MCEVVGNAPLLRLKDSHLDEAFTSVRSVCQSARALWSSAFPCSADSSTTCKGRFCGYNDKRVGLQN
jgi:hypothetical protein